MQVDFGNPGNLFFCRHFLDVDLHHSDDSGDQFKLLWHTALTGISDGRTDDYNKETLSWNRVTRSEEHTSELQTLMRISYAVFCLKKKNINTKPYLINNDIS